MFKTKLLILLLISSILVSCTKNKNNDTNVKFSLAYIGGEYDGLVLKNLLTDYLKSFDLYDKKSNHVIKSFISHSSKLYITNIDNTSDRTRIDSNLNIEITDNENNCNTYTYNENVSQFYIFADSSKYISNNTAIDKIKYNNTDALVKRFINSIDENMISCKNLNNAKN